MPHLRANGIDIYYEIAGEGPRLLCLPGSSADLRNGSVGRPLQQRFTVLTLDQRGLGRTQAPGPCTMADYAEDAVALLDAVGWERCHLLGVSFGGMVAQEVAIRAPERIERLVLASSSSGGAGGASAPLHEYDLLPIEEQAIIRLELADSRQDAAWRAAHPAEVAAHRARLEAAAGRPEEERRGARLQLLARADHDTYERLHLVTVPTLICGGRYDRQAPPENQEALLARIPGARLQYFEGGHGFLAQAPRAYEAITTFLLASPEE